MWYPFSPILEALRHVKNRWQKIQDRAKEWNRTDLEIYIYFWFERSIHDYKS